MTQRPSRWARSQEHHFGTGCDPWTVSLWHTSYSLFSGFHKVNHLVLHALLAMMFLPWSQLAMDWHLWKCDSKSTSPFFRCVNQVFCCSQRKLTHCSYTLPCCIIKHPSALTLWMLQAELCPPKDADVEVLSLSGPTNMTVYGDRVYLKRWLN